MSDQRNCRKCGIGELDPLLPFHCEVDHVGHDFVPAPPPIERETPEGEREGTDDMQTGLYEKFRVERRDGSSESGGKHEQCRYFVLDLDHDKFSGPALHAYVAACEGEYPDLAADLRVQFLRKMPIAPAVATERAKESYDSPRRFKEAVELLKASHDALTDETIKAKILDFIAPLAPVTAEDIAWAQRVLGGKS